MIDTATIPGVSAGDSIRPKGILHFTIGVRDHRAAATYYSDLLNCRHLRSNHRYAFMECGGTYFVLATMPNHVNPNGPADDGHHHAFIVEPDEFDRALKVLEARGIRLVRYSDEGHKSFPGRHAYFHDPDGNCIELIDLYDTQSE
jgi:catechol 2,3-dioxygenase-like lactoylglutathione lyase family enzyme